MKRITTFLLALLLVFATRAAAQQTFTSGLTSNGATTTKSGVADTGKVILTQLADPSAPTPIVNGTPGATTYTYFIVGHDSAATCGTTEGVSNPSPAGTVTNGNATLNGTNFISLTLPSSPLGYAFYDVLKSNTSTSLATCVGKGSTVNDTGQSTSAYTAPTRNSTADLSASAISIPLGSLTVGSLTANGGISITGTRTNGADQINNVSVNGVINVKTYGASGSDNTYTCTMLSTTTTLTCTASTDFTVGEGVAIPTAGAATPITGASSLVITTLTSTGASNGTTNDCYEILAKDPVQGTTAVSSSACQASGPAAGSFSTQTGLNVAFTGGNSANARYGIYRSINGGSYVFVNSTTASPYKDYGTDMTKTWDWPAVPAAQNQTLYAKVVSGSGTTWTLDTAATNTATSVTVRHDDTIAVQAAYDAAIKQVVYWPAGRYHINQIQLYPTGSGTSRAGYTFNNTSLNYDAAGSIIINNTGVRTLGDGNGKSRIARDMDWVSNIRGAMFNVTPSSWHGYFQAQNSNGTFPFTTYAFNTATHGQFCVTMTTAGNAANFNVGDLAFLTGGQASNGSFTAPLESPVVSTNSSTGVVCLADALPVTMPWGSGISNAAEDLTTNSVDQRNIEFGNLTIESPNTAFTNTATYNLNVHDIDLPEFGSSGWAFAYNNSCTRTILDHNRATQMGFFEWPLCPYFTMTNNTWGLPYATQQFTIADGSSTPLIATNNTFILGCGSGIAVDGTIATSVTTNNTVESECSTGASSFDRGAFLLPSQNTASLLYAINFSNNNFHGNNRTIGTGGTNANAMPPGNFSGNTFNWEHGNFNTALIGLHGPITVSNNTIRIQGNAGANAETIFGVGPVVGSGPPVITGNNVIVDTNVEGIGYTILDPGSSYTSPIQLTGNTVIGTQTGMSANLTDTPNVINGSVSGIDSGISTKCNPTGLCLQFQSINYCVGSAPPTATQISPSTVGTHLCWTFALANGGATQAIGTANPPSGFVTVDKGGSRGCTFYVNGTAGTTSIFAGPSTTCSVSQGNAGTLNLSIVATVLTLQNNTTDNTNPVGLDYFIL